MLDSSRQELRVATHEPAAGYPSASYLNSVLGVGLTVVVITAAIMLRRAEKAIRGLLIVGALFGVGLAVAMTDVPAPGLFISFLASFVLWLRVSAQRNQSARDSRSPIRPVSSARKAREELDYSRELADRGASDASVNYFNDGGSPTADSFEHT